MDKYFELGNTNNIVVTNPNKLTSQTIQQPHTNTSYLASKTAVTAAFGYVVFVNTAKKKKKKKLMHQQLRRVKV